MREVPLWTFRNKGHGSWSALLKSRMCVDSEVQFGLNKVTASMIPFSTPATIQCIVDCSGFRVQGPGLIKVDQG
jgi:hypothetical protein